MVVGERNRLIVLLAATAGSVDAWSYFVLGHVFVANMTGNTVLLGWGLSQHTWLSVAHPLLAIASYGAGAFTGALLTRRVDPSAVWSRQVTAVLALEALLLTVAAIVWAARAPGGSVLRYALVAVAALALGLQSASMQALKLPGIVTTYITGTWTTLWSNLAHLVAGKQHTAEERRELAMQATVVVTYCAAAAVSGLLAHASRQAAGALPAACVLVVVVLAAAANQPPAQSSGVPASPQP